MELLEIYEILERVKAETVRTGEATGVVIYYNSKKPVMVRVGIRQRTKWIKQFDIIFDRRYKPDSVSDNYYIGKKDCKIDASSDLYEKADFLHQYLKLVFNEAYLRESIIKLCYDELYDNRLNNWELNSKMDKDAKSNMRDDVEAIVRDYRINRILGD
jgi:hypothetical protein